MSSDGGIISPTITLEAAALERWDVVIVGAGPAGSAAAIELARCGRRVLLVDKASFPRWKVCGCCLNASAVEAAAQLGLGGLEGRLGARPLDRLELAYGRSRAAVSLRGSLALSREVFDAALVRSAIVAGCDFLDRTRAGASAVEPDGRTVHLVRATGDDRTVHSRVVLAADGLAARFGDGLGTVRSRRSHIGLGAVVDDRTGALAEPATITMAIGRGGYVGAVRLEDGRTNLAAAVAPGTIRRAGSPVAAIAAILRSARRPVPPVLESATFLGTPALTHARTELAASGLLVLGDSAGYVEPFSGEGIAWSLHSGIAAASCADAILDGRASEADWAEWWRGNIGPQQRRCAVLSGALRLGPALRPALAAINVVPRLGAALASAFGGRPRVVRA